MLILNYKHMRTAGFRVQCSSTPWSRIEVASGKFSMVTAEAEFTRLGSELSFLQVRSTMTLQEMIHQVKAEICEDR